MFTKDYLEKNLEKMFKMLFIPYGIYKNRLDETEFFLPDMFTIVKTVERESDISQVYMVDKPLNYLYLTANEDFIFFDNENKMNIKNEEIEIYCCKDCGCINFVSDTVKQKCRNKYKYCIEAIKYSDIKSFYNFVKRTLYYEE